MIATNQKSREPEKSSDLGAKNQAIKKIRKHATGIDIGSTFHFIAVEADAVSPDESPVRRFGAFTHQLDEAVEWLKACKVQTVAMESTGVYWIPLFQKIEAAGIEVILVNARDLRNVPGRKKTDVSDCQWIQQLHSFGLLNGAFRPTDAICRMRTIMRHRANLVASAGQQLQLMQKALQQMNILLHHVVSDLDGQTGLKILDAIIAGERDPKALVALRDERIKRSTPQEMEAALQGDWRPEQLFVLGQCLETYRSFQNHIAECDVHLQEVMNQMVAEVVVKEEIQRVEAPELLAPEQPVKTAKKKKKKQGNAPVIDLLPQLKTLIGIDLTETMGISVLGSLVLISEIGLDMSVWRSEKAFASWLGLSPNHKISGGKVLSNRTRPVANRAASVLRLMALSIGKTDTVLGHFYRRIRARAGAPKAITATARKLACLVYHLIKHKTPYIEPDLAKYLERFEKQRIQNLTRQAKTLGFQLVPIETVTE